MDVYKWLITLVKNTTDPNLLPAHPSQDVQVGLFKNETFKLYIEVYHYHQSAANNEPSLWLLATYQPGRG